MLFQTFRRAALVGGLLGLAAFAAPAMAAEAAPKPLIEQGALDALKKMSDTLKAAKAIELSITDFREVPSSQGQMVTLVTSADITAERPNKFRAEANFNGAETSFVFDGKNFTALDKGKNLYVTAELGADTMEAFFKKLQESRGIEFSVADFLASDPYAIFSKDLTNAYDVGTTTIDGVTTQHLVFSAKGLEWQLWIDPATNLPRLFTVIYNDVPREPRFLVNFKSWNLKATPAADAFTFTPPKDAASISFLPAGTP